MSHATAAVEVPNEDPAERETWRPARPTPTPAPTPAPVPTQPPSASRTTLPRLQKREKRDIRDELAVPADEGELRVGACFRGAGLVAIVGGSSAVLWLGAARLALGLYAALFA